MPATQALAPASKASRPESGIPVMPSPAPAGQVMPCQLVSSAAQVRHAREQARKALFDWGLGDHAWLAELIVSELLANAIRHGRGTARIGVSHAAGDLRVEVHDDGQGRPVRRQPDADDEAGRGLALIDALGGG